MYRERKRDKDVENMKKINESKEASFQGVTEGKQNY